MQDKTTIGVSEEFRQYIEALVEEVVCGGIPLDGVEGRKFTSKLNCNSILSPRGYLSRADLRDNPLRKTGNYWSSYRDKLSYQGRVFCLCRSGVDADEFSLPRVHGCSVRPVI